MWRCAVMGLGLAAIVYLAGSQALSIATGTHEFDGPLGVALGYAVLILVSIIVLKKTLNTRFKEFSVHLIPHSESALPVKELAELRKEKETLEDILSNISPDVLMVVSPDRTIRVCNSSVQRMFGYEMDEVIGRETDILYFDRRSNPGHSGEIYEILETEGYHIGLATGIKKNGELLPLEIITGKLRSRAGAVLLLRDISERTRMEAELKRHQEHLEEQVQQRTAELESVIEHLHREIAERTRAEERAKKLNEELEQRVKERTAALEIAYKELKETDRMKDEFLSLVSHEFRTPLTSIMSFSEILMNYPDENSSTQREFLSIINSESKRLTRLVNNVLDLSKIQAGRMEWRFQKGDIRAIIERAVKSMGSLVTDKSLHLESEIEEGLPGVIADEDRIVQVLINLLSNAVKFTPHGGTIKIAATLLEADRRDGTKDILYISVSDTGVGILAKDLDRIFEPFRQCGDTLNDKPAGTGLGLSICKQIICAHHGTLWAESVPGQGSTFHITLPVMPLEATVYATAYQQEGLAV